MRIGAILILTTIAAAAGVAAVQAGAVKRITGHELAADPGRYMGQDVEIAAAYCAQDDAAGGGYRSSTDGDVYIAARALSPAAARKKIDDSCGGLDLIEHSSFCRARVRFNPSSFARSKDVDPPKTVLVVNTAEIYLNF